jgi:hypothetical protein
VGAHVQAGLGVQGGQGFVQEQEPGVGCQCPGQGDLLGLPAGDLVRASGGQGCQVKALQPRVSGRAGLPAPGPLDPGA